MTRQPDHWNEHARQWSLIGPPLRPAAEDIRLLEAAVQDWRSCTAVAAPRALLCGVTPEIARMRWPAGTRLIAVDHSRPMIAGVWPAAQVPGVAVCGDWLALPFPFPRLMQAANGCACGACRAQRLIPSRRAALPPMIRSFSMDVGHSSTSSGTASPGVNG